MIDQNLRDLLKTPPCGPRRGHAQTPTQVACLQLSRARGQGHTRTWHTAPSAPGERGDDPEESLSSGLERAKFFLLTLRKAVT